jgi:hypothetical protein
MAMATTNRPNATPEAIMTERLFFNWAAAIWGNILKL